MTKIPVIEQKDAATVKVTLEDIVAAPEKMPTETGQSLAELNAEHRQRSDYVAHIKQYVSGRRGDSPTRVEPNVPV